MVGGRYIIFTSSLSLSFADGPFEHGRAASLRWQEYVIRRRNDKRETHSESHVLRVDRAGAERWAVLVLVVACAGALRSYVVCSHPSLSKAV